MINELDWQVNGNRLILKGGLTRDSLLPIWQERINLLKQVSVIDVSALERVDSAGLAMILQFISDARENRSELRVEGITDRLETLINLYNLQDIVNATKANC